MNDPNASANLAEIQAQLLKRGKWRGKTPTGKDLTGGLKRKTRRLRRSKKTQRRRR